MPIEQPTSILVPFPPYFGELVAEKMRNAAILVKEKEQDAILQRLLSERQSKSQEIEGISRPNEAK